MATILIVDDDPINVKLMEAYLHQSSYEILKTYNGEEALTVFNNLDVDLVLLAMGFVHVEHNKLLSDFDIDYDSRGNISINKNYQTSVPDVFAAGDSATGTSLVVSAIYHGRQAAEAINEYLAGKEV